MLAGGALATITTVLGTASTPAAASTDQLHTTTQFSYVSAPGDPIGGGQTKTIKPFDARFQVTGTLDHIVASVESETVDFRLEFTPGVGHVFEPGTYPDAERVPFETGRAPGLDITSGSSGCNMIWGSITIDQISVDADGALNMLDLSFVQHCESADAPPLNGTLLFQQLPLSFTLDSFTGTQVGADRHQQWMNRDSVIETDTELPAIEASISGHRVSWDLRLRPPTGQQFEPGKTYQTTQFGDATHAGLRLGGPDFCTDSTGTLTVKELVMSGDSVEHLSITFAYHCSYYLRHYEGALHYLA